MYDVLFTYEKFIGPLPESFKEFAKVWTDAFPIIYDTKCLANHAIRTNREKGEKTIF